MIDAYPEKKSSIHKFKDFRHLKLEGYIQNLNHVRRAMPADVTREMYYWCNLYEQNIKFHLKQIHQGTL